MTGNAASKPVSTPLQLNDKEFGDIRALIRDVTGISMGDSKRHLITRRLGARLKATDINTFRGYIDYVKNGDPLELEEFTNSVTTNLTSFFREDHHFEFLTRTAIPGIVARKNDNGKRLRIWSAGCSTGEEPYSIAMTLAESLHDLAQWDAKILCTDIDSEVLKTCKAGVYSQQRLEKIPESRSRRWFKKLRGEKEGFLQVSPQLQQLTVFKQLNLMREWPMKRRFDVIFCRNVIIYFDKPTQRVLVERYANVLADGGYLILGHSESLINVSDRFSLIGNTVYQKNAE